MCGIVGLFLKNEALEPRLGTLLAGMLAAMRDRGPDSAGFAVYTSGPGDGRIKLTVRGPAGTDFATLLDAIPDLHPAEDACVTRGTQAVLRVPAAHEAALRAAIRAAGPMLSVVGAGLAMEVYKDVGPVTDVTRRFGLEAMGGSHGVGHTRMATESAVTADGAHPYTTGLDQCLVHNGSLSNHNALRRTLTRQGMRFETENDTEVAAAYLTWRMREGDSLREALMACLAALDGFFTFVVGTRTGFAVLRDPISCKPAVMAETADWVAFGSEYRALTDLPGIGRARVWEPAPANVYAWERAA